MRSPIIHNDEPTTDDNLKRSKFAAALASIAQECSTPMVIGLYGGWGIGKTSLMHQIELNLDSSKTRTVWFDPWRHQFAESPALALAQAVATKVEGKLDEAKKILAVIATAFGSMLLKATTNISFKEINELGRLYEEERFQVRAARVRLHEHFRALIESVRGDHHRMVFFIDDLDRCMPDRILSMLEALKLYLNVPQCVYFVAVDKQALDHSIQYHYKEIEPAEFSKSYLDKIVQLPFSIPPIDPASMEEFLKPLLSAELESVKELLVYGLGDNPRQVKRFVNTLTLNHLLASINRCKSTCYFVVAGVVSFYAEESKEEAG